MKKIIFSLLILGLVCPKNFATAAHSKKHQDYSRVIEFLKVLKKLSAADPKAKNGISDIERVLPYISEKGLAVYFFSGLDFRKDGPCLCKKISPKSIRKQLRTKDGKAYWRLTGISGSSFEESSLDYEPIDNGVVVRGVGGYRLVFYFEKGLLRLAEIGKPGPYDE